MSLNSASEMRSPDCSHLLPQSCAWRVTTLCLGSPPLVSEGGRGLWSKTQQREPCLLVSPDMEGFHPASRRCSCSLLQILGGDSFRFSEPASTAAVGKPNTNVQVQEWVRLWLFLHGTRLQRRLVSLWTWEEPGHAMLASLLDYWVCCRETERWAETHSSALFLGLFQTLLSTSELP